MVERFSTVLQLHKLEKSTGRKLALSIIDTLTLGLYKQRLGMETKKALYELCDLPCSYKTMVVNMNRFMWVAGIILALVLKLNRDMQHPIKHVDSTSLEVCKFKNANAHKTMKEFAAFSKNKHGTYFGLKLHLISDFERKMLALKFTPATVDDRAPVMEMSVDIDGLLIGDAGYVSQKLEHEFYEEHRRIFMSKPRSNMKKLATEMELKLYDTRALIELNFRNLKLFYRLVTSLPRSVTGYFANYIYSILAYAIS